MSDSFKSALGARLKELRVRRGLTLEQVRELTEEMDWPISRSRLSALERGQLDLKASDIYPLTRVYGFAVSDLIAESIIAHSRRRFSQRLDAKALFEEGKRLFKLGQPLEAGWAFDEAHRRAETSETAFRELCLVSAAHCYIRLRAYSISLRRIERVIDEAERGSDTYLTAVSQAAWMHARQCARGRSELYLDVVNNALDGELSAELRALMLINKSVALSEFGDPREAASCAQQSAKLRIKTGEFDQAAKAMGAAAGYLLQENGNNGAAALRLARDAHNLLNEDSEVETRLRVGVVLSDAELCSGETRSPRTRLMELAKIAMRFGFHREAARSYALLAKIDTLEGRDSQAKRWTAKLNALPIHTAGNDHPATEPGSRRHP